MCVYSHATFSTYSIYFLTIKVNFARFWVPEPTAADSATDQSRLQPIGAGWRRSKKWKFGSSSALWNWTPFPLRCECFARDSSESLAKNERFALLEIRIYGMFLTVFPLFMRDGSDSLFFTSESLFCSFAHKKRANRSKTEERILNPVWLYWRAAGKGLRK